MTGLQILGIIIGFIFICGLITLIITFIAFIVWIAKIPRDSEESE